MYQLRGAIPRYSLLHLRDRELESYQKLKWIRVVRRRLEVLQLPEWC